MIAGELISSYKDGNPRSTGASAALSPRQREVLQLLVEAKSTKEKGTKRVFRPIHQASHARLMICHDAAQVQGLKPGSKLSGRGSICGPALMY
jgi:hypothetical protein